MFSQESVQKEDNVIFYSGLLNLQVLNTVFNHVAAAISTSECQKLTFFQECMLVMIKLWLNCHNKDLAIHFNNSPAVSQSLLKWLIATENYTGLLSSIIRGKVAVILDCFQVFCERPSNLEARAATWSSYKHHNILKVLLGITPQGSVSYVSNTWGSWVSEKYLTKHCGILITCFLEM